MQKNLIWVPHTAFGLQEQTRVSNQYLGFTDPINTL